MRILLSVFQSASSLQYLERPCGSTNSHVGNPRAAGFARSFRATMPTVPRRSFLLAACAACARAAIVPTGPNVAASTASATSISAAAMRRRFGAAAVRRPLFRAPLTALRALSGGATDAAASGNTKQE
eukprot:6210841-Pleurochrysis_carterae.AAC.5